MEKQRARNKEDKAKRKQSIVDALHTILKGSQSMPSASEIAKYAGVTKGAIYLYFKTREEIFLTLFLQEAELSYSDMFPRVRGDHYELRTFRDGFIRFIVDHPVFMHLGLLAPSVLEHNVSADFLRAFKRSGADGIALFAEAWQPRHPGLSVAQLQNFTLRMFLLSQVLWQHHNPPKRVFEVIDAQENWLLQGNLQDSLRESFDWMWTGLVSSSLP